MSDPMAEIRASFFVECEELLEALQDGLSAMDGGDSDGETINVCFRAVHSMKGGAGAFGLDGLVRFAHRYETVMDEVRSGRLSPDRDAMQLFFRAADVLSDLVRASRDGATTDEAETESVLGELEALVGAEALAEEADEAEAAADFQPMTLSIGLDGPPALPELGGGEAGYRIRFAPHAALFASGNEPLHLFGALGRLGTMEVTADLSSVPDLDALDPEGACLAWDIALDSEAAEDEVREVFDFVEGICTLEIGGGGSAPALPALDELPPTIDDSAAAPPIDTPGAPGAPSPRITLGEPAARAPTPAVAPPDAETPRVAAADRASSPASDGTPAPGSALADNAPTAAGAAKPALAAQPKATVRVDLDRIDRLVNLVGELVINQAMLSQSVLEAGLPSNSPVARGLDEFMQLTRNIQDSVMMIRAQPVKSLFQRMSRIVREAGAATGKRVRLVTDGEGTEVDKTVIERLADPLTHMIRNAVDHGLERGEDRIATGKPEEGRVFLTAAHRSGRVVIEVADDGGGINRVRVQQIAEGKGLIAEGLSLSDAEIDNLLFLPGFSTAGQVSDLSGRGVGMDVVRSAIQDLGGRITIQSEPGQGTTFSISLPLTLAVLDGMVVKAAVETLVVPLGAIVETLSLQDNEIRTIGPGADVLHIRESFVPLLDLGVELGYRTRCDSYEGSVVLLITQEDGARAALIVDTIEEQRQVVIKGLQDSYGHVPGIAAATILGDGKIALILDPVDLMSSVAGRGRTAKPTLDLAG
jgi:two-component system chemotaxis sensor kinase CheA